MSFFKKLASCRDEGGCVDWMKFWVMAIQELNLSILPPPASLPRALADLRFKNPAVFNGCFGWNNPCLVSSTPAFVESMMKGEMPLAAAMRALSQNKPLDTPHPGSPIDSEEKWTANLESHGFKVHIDDNAVFPPVRNEENLPYGYYVVDLEMGEEFKNLPMSDADIIRAIREKEGTPLHAIEGVQLITAYLDILFREAHREPQGAPALAHMWFLGSMCPNWHSGGNEYMFSSFCTSNRSVEEMEYLGAKRRCWGAITIWDKCACHPNPFYSYPYFRSWAKL